MASMGGSFQTIKNKSAKSTRVRLSKRILFGVMAASSCSSACTVPSTARSRFSSQVLPRTGKAIQGMIASGTAMAVQATTPMGRPMLQLTSRSVDNPTSTAGSKKVSSLARRSALLEDGAVR